VRILEHVENVGILNAAIVSTRRGVIVEKIKIFEMITSLNFAFYEYVLIY
jgi:hypothetical protein